MEVLLLNCGQVGLGFAKLLVVLNTGGVDDDMRGGVGGYGGAEVVGGGLLVGGC